MTSATRDIAVPTPNFAAWGNLLVAIVLLNGGNLLLDSIAKGAGITPRPVLVARSSFSPSFASVSRSSSMCGRWRGCRWRWPIR